MKRSLLFPPDQIGSSRRRRRRRSSHSYKRWSSVLELKRTPHHSLLLQCNHRGMSRLPRAPFSSSKSPRGLFLNLLPFIAFGVTRLWSGEKSLEYLPLFGSPPPPRNAGRDGE
ncbi:hypothetical protein F2Q69_00024891 [Brassica cretica]|uniref:Uncharacterized protein n=1 Tax=Brassica cretica TaxID=69181 RepID=A0A8S9QIK7_BRACR|nr:hypothetical protein F2Q69_00024891 [Brassica cretica]